jgi:hypothetical protein
MVLQALESKLASKVVPEVWPKLVYKGWQTQAQCTNINTGRELLGHSKIARGAFGGPGTLTSREFSMFYCSTNP